MGRSRRRINVAILVGASVLASCSGGGGPTSLPASISPTTTSPIATLPNVASPQSVHRVKHELPADATLCSTLPVSGLQVTATSLAVAPNGSTSFTACTQYSSVYKITVSPSDILTSPTS